MTEKKIQYRVRYECKYPVPGVEGFKFINHWQDFDDQDEAQKLLDAFPEGKVNLVNGTLVGTPYMTKVFLEHEEEV